MATFTTFEDIEVWKKGHQVALEIYRVTDLPGLKKDFSMKDQMRRSAVSITSNIAEGFDREGNKEFVRFLRMSKGSSAELRSQVILAKDLQYIDTENFEQLNQQLIEVNKMIGGLIKYLRARILSGKN
jgi:four helix bundle protein